MSVMKNALLIVALAAPSSSSAVLAQTKLFPSDAGMLDVTAAPYNAVPDDGVDDTRAIQEALYDAVGNTAGKTVYFPAGTYLVSDKLIWKKRDGTWGPYANLQGQGRDATVIKLQDSAAGFTDPAKPRAVIYTASWNSNQNQPPGVKESGGGNDGYLNFIYDLTVDVGRGNAGAVGVDFICSNIGGITNVRIVSSDPDRAGKAGLNLTRSWQGPGLIKGVEVVGFDAGIVTRGYQYTMVLEDITLRHQREVGISHDAITVALRRLVSENQVPALRIRRTGPVKGLFTLLDSVLTGGAPANSAIEVVDGELLARNVITGGYQSAIKRGDAVEPGTTVGEYNTAAPLSVFPGEPLTLNLPIEETPEYHQNDLGQWASVRAYGAIPDDELDDTEAIQRAIDESGKPVIYFPNGAYRIKSTIVVRGKVRHLMGMFSDFRPMTGSIWGDAANRQPWLRIADGDHPVVTLDRMRI